MSALVDPEIIEEIVGAKRDEEQHLARAVSDEEMVYVLHSQKCKDSGVDLRECEYSLALDEGIDLATWSGFQDRPVAVGVLGGRLVPVIAKWSAEDQP